MNRYSDESYIDPLSDDWLPELRKDIPYFLELDINAIFVNHLGLQGKPDKALKLLQDNGVHVLLLILKNSRRFRSANASDDTYEGLSIQELYSTELVQDTFRIIDETADFDNVLGFSMDFSFLGAKGTSRLSPIHRAAVRDAKNFLALRRGRQVPVGASFSGDRMTQGPGLEFVAAGEPAERIDFFSFDNFSWYGAHSSFQISGYEYQVQDFGNYPVPMFFSGYGTAFDEPRALREVECLFSPDMTRVFSGGFLEYYGCTPVLPTLSPRIEQDSQEEPKDTPAPKDDGLKEDDESSGGGSDDEYSNYSDDDFEAEEDNDDLDVGGYELMRVEEDGSRRPKMDFWTYKAKLEQVANRPEAEVFGNHEKKNYEGWCGEMPKQAGFWLADPTAVPRFPLNWNEVMRARTK